MNFEQMKQKREEVEQLAKGDWVLWMSEWKGKVLWNDSSLAIKLTDGKIVIIKEHEYRYLEKSEAPKQGRHYVSQKRDNASVGSGDCLLRISTNAQFHPIIRIAGPGDKESSMWRGKLPSGDFLYIVSIQRKVDDPKYDRGFRDEKEAKNFLLARAL